MFHIHWHRLELDWHLYDWGGILCQRRMWRCRCGSKKQVVRGSLKV